MPAYLPILTFDEHRLRPSFGYVFDQRWLDPYESIVSLLWKYVRANSIAGHVAVAEFGREAVDPYEGVEAYRETVDIPRLKNALGVSRKTLYEALIPTHRRGAVNPCFRYCARCLGRGYHSVVHQFENVRRCPIHDRRLETACRVCGDTAPYRLTARLLEAPFVCPGCRSPYGTKRPSLVPRFRMPMKDLVQMTRTRIARCRY